MEINKTQVPTEEPTIEVTEKPTTAPTVEPTATPLPEGWIIDSTGRIPPTVEILVPDDSIGDEILGYSFCITKVNGKTTLQKWKENGKKIEWNVPDEFLQKDRTSAYGDIDRNLLLFGIFEEYMFEKMLVYYEDVSGKWMYFEATNIYTHSEGYRIGTTNGEAIRYSIGEDYYEIYKFSDGITVMADSEYGFWITGEGHDELVLESEIEWTRVPLND